MVGGEAGICWTWAAPLLIIFCAGPPARKEDTSGRAFFRISRPMSGFESPTALSSGSASAGARQSFVKGKIRTQDFSDG
jgi:hypothetical protein